MALYKDELLSHEYDGIQEYDNPMPGWWSGIFVLTIIWSGVYWIGIELNTLDRYEDTLKEETRELEALRRAHREAQPPVVISAEMLASATLDDERVVEGRGVFATNCASCHGDYAQGQIGPNLTDDYWLYGAEPMDVHKVIDQGAPNGMPAWGSILTPREVVSLVAFVVSTRGTNPEGAKAPQGELVKAQPALIKEAK